MTDDAIHPQQTPIVEAIGVSKRYGATVALNDARIRVLPGESHALVGRNGAGKSTLVGILTGLRAPDSGEVRFSGEPAPPVADREAWRARVACVYQHSTIIPDLTVAENLFVNRQPPERGFISWTAAPPRGARAARPLERRGLRGHARRRPPGRGAPAGRDRPRPLLRRPLHHPRRADRPARRRGDQAALRAHARAAGAGRHLPLHLAPPAGGLRDLPGGDRAARRPPHRLRAGRRSAEGPADRGDDRRAGATSASPMPPAATVPADAPVALEVDGLAGEDFRDVSFTVRRGEVVGISGATSSGRVGVAEAIAGLGRHTGRRHPHRRPRAAVAATCRRRWRSASAACRRAATTRAWCCPQSVARQHHHDHRRPARRARLHRAAAARREVPRAAIATLGVVTEGPEQLGLRASPAATSRRS